MLPTVLVKLGHRYLVHVNVIADYSVWSATIATANYSLWYATVATADYSVWSATVVTADYHVWLTLVVCTVTKQSLPWQPVLSRKPSG